MKEDVVYLLALSNSKYIAEKELEKNPCAVNAQKVLEYSKRIDEVLANIDKDYDELNKYKELQKGLGCPLEVVFKALKNGFYDEYGNLYKVGEFCLDYNWLLSNVSDKYLTFNVEDTYFEFKLADYKITWWLKKDRSE